KCCVRIGRSSGGDDDPFRGHRLPRADEPAGMGVDELRACLEDLRAGILQSQAIEPFEAANFPILCGNQLFPVEACFAHLPAESGRVLEMFGELRCIDEQLFRHAAANDAGSPEPVFLRNRHPLAEGSREPSRPDTAGTSADHEKVVVESGHVRLLQRYAMSASYRGSNRKRKSPDRSGLLEYAVMQQ